MSIDFCGCPLCTALPGETTFTRVQGGATITGTLPTAQQLGAQQLGAPDSGAEPAPTVFDLVKADLDARDRKGSAEHGGKPLLASCRCGDPANAHYLGGSCYARPGECHCMDYRPQHDFLREAYEEALDLAVYLRGALAERETQR